MNIKTKSILSSIAFFILLYLIYRFYTFTKSGSYDVTTVPSVVVLGILLIIAIGIVSALRYYYDNVKDKQTKISQLGAEVSAYGIIADEQSKFVTINIYGSTEEDYKLKNEKKLYLNLHRFNMPVHINDHVNFYIIGQNKAYTSCKVSKIDANNKVAEIILL